MFNQIFFILAFVLSAGFSVLVGAAIITYIRRTWQQIQADSKGSVQSQLLDAVDQVQVQLYSMSERLERLERRLEDEASLPETSTPSRELGPGDEG